MNGEWTAWSHWTPCSQSCGKSVKLRMRKCDNPAPSYGGEKCSGDAEEQMKCDVPACSGRNILVLIVCHCFIVLLCSVVLCTQPETRKLQQVCYHQADIRMRSHRLLRLDNKKSVTSC